MLKDFLKIVYVGVSVSACAIVAVEIWVRVWEYREAQGLAEAGGVGFAVGVAVACILGAILTVLHTAIFGDK